MKKPFKTLVWALALILTAASLAACSGTPAGEATQAPAQQGGSQVINIFTWAEYIPGDVLEAFSKDTGISYNYTTFESEEEMLAKLQAVDGGTYDIVLASDYILDIARKEGLLGELDKSKIPNYKNINSAYQGQYFDPENKYTVPYAAGTPLIVYDPSKVSFEIKGYEDLWNPALKDSVVLIEQPRVIMGITLKTLGHSFNTTDPATLEQMKEKLLALKPQVRAFDAETPHNLLLSGECSVGFMFSSQVVLALDGNKDFKVVYPQEGMGWGIDSLVITKNAPNRDAAHTFLNYVLQPETGAQISEEILYICCNEASLEYLSEEYLNNKALYIPKDVLGDTEYIEDVGEATPIYSEIWTEFKQ